MRKSEHVTAFYVEVLLMIVVVTVMVLVLTNVFALSRMESATAKSLTNAVCLAENAAEAFSASSTPEQLLALLDEGGNAGFAEGAAVTTLRASYDADMRPDAEGGTVLLITWEPEGAWTGGLVRCTITVLSEDGSEVYTLRTAVCLREAAA